MKAIELRVVHPFAENAPPTTKAESISKGIDDLPIFFAFGGFAITVTVLDSLITKWQPTAVVTGQWFAIGATVPLYFLAYAVAAFRLRVPTWLRQLAEAIRIILACAYIVAGLWLATIGHRYYLLSIAAVQALLVYSVIPRSRGPRISAIALFAAAFVAWVAAAPLSYTSFENLLFNGATSSNLAILAVVSALVLTVAEVFSIKTVRRGSRIKSAAIATLIGACFLELALRTDGLLTDWIPYHRSYYTEPATFVRAGHWLLWDIPSQYGFLSIAAIAVAPGATTWQSLYILTAAVLTAQSLMFFDMLRTAGGGVRNIAFATLVPAATFLGDQAYRWPFGPRLYPQHGVRFIWLFVLMYVIFKMSVHEDNPPLERVYRYAGYTAWVIGCFWSFESAVWATLTWVTFLGSRALIDAFGRRSWRERAFAFAPLLVLPCVLVACVILIDAYYALRLRHIPDWQSFLEFSAIYAGGAPYTSPIDRLGPGWTLLILLGGAGTPLIVAIALRRWSALPPLAASWAAAWSASIYFAGETFDNHVNAIVGVFGFAFATTIYVARKERLATAPMMLAVASFIPVAVILIATWFGNGGSLLKMHAPFLPGYSFDRTAEVRPISGELASVMSRAGVKPDQRVVLPDDIGWSKLDTGLFMPFVRDSSGRIREVVSWIPVGPAGGFGIYDTLPPDRQQVYIDRFLHVGHEAGWLITYHQIAHCAVFAPQAFDSGHWRSANFSVTHCMLRGSTFAHAERTK